MKFYLILFLMSFSQLAKTQQINNWKGVLSSDYDVLKKENVKSLVLKKNGKIIKTVKVFPEKNLLISTDSLGIENFTFNDFNQIISIQSNKYQTRKKIGIDYKNNFVKTISLETENNNVRTFHDFSYTYFQNQTYKEFRYFSFDSIKNDTIDFYGKKYLFNQKNPELSYAETYKKDSYRTRSYFNKTNVAKNISKNSYTVDSTFFENNKEVNYRFENFGDEKYYIIKRDSIFTTKKHLGKKTYEKTEYNYLIFKEINYDKNEKIEFVKKYSYFKNKGGKNILWEIITYDENGKIKNKEFPNKAYYKLKNGVLIDKKNYKNVEIMSCGGENYNDKRILPMNLISVYSPSIMCSESMLLKFNNNFDTSAIELDDKEDIIFNTCILKEKEITIAYKSNVYDLDNELKRTMKSTFLWKDKIEKFIKNLSVEVETFNGNKTSFDLQKHPELFSIKIYTIITSED